MTTRNPDEPPVGLQPGDRAGTTGATAELRVGPARFRCALVELDGRRLVVVAERSVPAAGTRVRLALGPDDPAGLPATVTWVRAGRDPLEAGIVLDSP